MKYSFVKLLKEQDPFASEIASAMTPTFIYQNSSIPSFGVANTGSFFSLKIDGRGKNNTKVLRLNADGSSDVITPFKVFDEGNFSIQFFAVKVKGRDVFYYSPDVSIIIRYENARIFINNNIRDDLLQLSKTSECIPAIEYIHYIRNWSPTYMDIVDPVELPQNSSPSATKVTPIPYGVNVVGIKFPEKSARIIERTQFLASDKLKDVQLKVVLRYDKNRTYFDRTMKSFEDEKIFVVKPEDVFKFLHHEFMNSIGNLNLTKSDINHILSNLNQTEALYDSDIPTLVQISHYQNRWSLTQDDSYQIVSCDKIISDLDVFSLNRIRYMTGSYFVSNNSFIVTRNELYFSLLDSNILSKPFNV